MGLIRTPYGIALVVSALAALAIWMPLQMQNLVVPHNEGCYGPFTDADYRALLSIRLKTWGGSFVITGACLLAILTVFQDYRVRGSIIALFVLWKAAALYFDIFGSPICWEPYENDTPFWVEPMGTGLAFALQPLAFVVLALTLIGLALWQWAQAIRESLKNH